MSVSVHTPAMRVPSYIQDAGTSPRDAIEAIRTPDNQCVPEKRYAFDAQYRIRHSSSNELSVMLSKGNVLFKQPLAMLKLFLPNIGPYAGMEREFLVAILTRRGWRFCVQVFESVRSTTFG